MAKAKVAARFEAVRLSFNVGIPAGFNPGNQADCNPGGSVICDPGTGGCGGGGMTCVGSSCSGSSATRELMFDSHILVDRVRLAALQKELVAVVNKYSR
jgi:hypothetical protein